MEPNTKRHCDQSHKDYYLESRNSKPTKRYESPGPGGQDHMEISSKDFSPKVLLGLMGWEGNMLTKDRGREGNSELVYHGLGQAVRHTLDASPTLYHRLCLYTLDVAKGY